jgi:hypothetical protein
MPSRPCSFVTGMLLVVGIVSFSFALTGPDTSDYVLVAYRVTPAQESLFVRDTAISPFWSAWDRVNTDSVRLDYVDLTVEKNAWVTGGAQFTGHGDAGMVIRAAYGAKGLYLYFQISDDSWMSPDAICLVLDRISSDSIRKCNPFECYFQPSWGWSLTNSSVSCRVQVGTASGRPTASVLFHDPNPDYCDPAPCPTPLDNLADLSRTALGLRESEWFFPWAWVGYGGLDTTPDVGRHCALSVSYDDADTAEPGLPYARTSLQWKERTPFYPCDDMTPPHTFCDAWGDIEFGPALESVVSVQPQLNHRNKRPGLVAQSTVSLRYDLTGRRLGTAGGMAAGVTVVRRAGAQGTRLVGVVRQGGGKPEDGPGTSH